MKIKYRDIRFSKVSAGIIVQANIIVNRYLGQGYRLTLRQLYYRFVAEDLFPDAWADPVSKSKNIQKNYKRLQSIVNDARLAGLMDWDAIEDRTRSLEGNNHWSSPEQIIEACASQYMIDKWEGQKNYVEAWVEKDALEGVVGKAAREVDINFFSCRGYASQTSIWEAAQRLLVKAKKGRQCVILHLGDHDPSGIDMTRDINERLQLFMGSYNNLVRVSRIALNMDQVRQYNPPPNPAKVTDSRFESYQAEYGDDSWELDALEPEVIHSLIVDNAMLLRNESLFDKRKGREERERGLLEKVARNWGEITETMD